ncbi:hypothetical protein GC088_01670 [Arthrobacter sp. JZ12]|uniref:hypothetical protein n=1 Tax=Arthrobacter sp. JZ12 TaxID=2654190 RepID=UPI002B45D9F8|nr:hypothetical protein [Arthrobacter sp. JZ12]WRH23949.1 hypothetical protein GC088_01670 [Arthrobacter sp. JZ12]
MTLLASRPNGSSLHPTPSPADVAGGTYVTTRSQRPSTAGSYVRTEQSGTVTAQAVRGRYVSLGRVPQNQREGRYTDRG